MWSWGEVATIITVTTAIFHCGLYIGVLIARLKVIEERQSDHQNRLDAIDYDQRVGGMRRRDSDLGH